jgi:hypothetical protein
MCLKPPFKPSIVGDVSSDTTPSESTAEAIIERRCKYAYLIVTLNFKGAGVSLAPIVPAPLEALNAVRQMRLQEAFSLSQLVGETSAISTPLRRSR